MNGKKHLALKTAEIVCNHWQRNTLFKISLCIKRGQLKEINEQQPI